MSWMRAALLLTSALTTACGHIVCETDADCPSDATCNQKACIKNSAPRPTPPAECGDRCEPDRTRCDFGPTGAETSFQRCGVGADGCSQWASVEVCGNSKFCEEPAGCLPYLTEGAACSGDGACGPDLLCSSLEELGGTGAATCRRPCGTTACPGADRCVGGLCVPASFCDGCTGGVRRCDARGAPEECRTVDTDCTRWLGEAACGGSDACDSGDCVGTVVAGGACGPDNSCVRGLVCLGDSQVCADTCAASGECGGVGCRPTRGSLPEAICTAGAGPRVDATCTLSIVSAAVGGGDWDPASPFNGATPPDPYVVVSGGGFYRATSAGTDTTAVAWNDTTPELPLLQFLALTVQLWDDDSPFSPPDLMGEWRLGASLAWDGAARDLTASLEGGTTRVEITARCTDR